MSTSDLKIAEVSTEDVLNLEVCPENNLKVLLGSWRRDGSNYMYLPRYI